MFLKNKAVLVLVFALFLSACSASINKEQEKAKDYWLEAFQEKSKQANSHLDGISLFLPVGMEIDNSDPNNILFKKGSRLYLLFVNPNEEQNSKILYDSTLKTAEKVRLNETFEKDNRLGFLIIQDIEEDLYELTVGIGGMKMTTETKASDIAHDAKLMMEIVSSIQLTGK